jgi:hypothetical protein
MMVYGELSAGSSISRSHYKTNASEIGTRPERVERTTCGTGIRCSIQLSYGRNFWYLVGTKN